MNLDLHYTDIRLVELYDLTNSGRDDTAFYRVLADELGAQRIIDLGCGTGVLTRLLATSDRQVTGVDPSPQMLDVARRNDHDRRVAWVEGTSAVLSTLDADLALMTGNVAQIFLDDAEWTATLADLARAVRPGGHLAFESRNLVARGWESWIPEHSRSVSATPFGPVEEWLTLDRVDLPLVSFSGHNRFLDTGEYEVVLSTLRFRSLGELATSLEAAGFVIHCVYGDWQRGPLTECSATIVLVAQRQ